MIRLASVFMACAALAGCRIERHTYVEPVEDRVLEARGADRHTFILEENGTTGFSWVYKVKGDEEAVSVSIAHRPPPATCDGMCGVPGTAEVCVRFHEGWSGPTEVTLLYQRPWSKETARTIHLSFYRKFGDRAFWK